MNSKAVLEDKAFSRRKIMFPSETFIELTLSPKDVKKVRRWEKEGHIVTPVWYATHERVLFINWTKFEEWKKR
jgi:hypothetical protein